MSDAPLSFVRVAAWIALAGGAALILGGALAWWRERAFLLEVLREIAPSGRIGTREELVRLKRRLSGAIRWDEARMHDPRPLLRASARRVLETGAGFCGENARVAVRLLRLAGVDAHRLYLVGERWGHVVVEHRWEGGWRLFDAHVDPRTELADADVGRIDTEDLRAFPNRAAGNPWRGSYRVPGLGRLVGMGRMRPPPIATAVAETPALVAVAAGILLALAAALVLLRA
jgi:hypothetical protein